MGKKNKEKKLSRKTKWLIVLGCLLVLLAGHILLNSLVNLRLHLYIDSFDPVAYEEGERVIPEKDAETGYYTLTSDRDLKILMMTDLHIGGGHDSLKKDKKTIYEVITMLQKEKPDLVVLCGDNTFAVPGPVYNGGGTINGLMAARVVLKLFEHEQVYFSTVFGNHDSEAIGSIPRAKIGKLYEKNRYHYCIYDPDFSDSENALPSISNQIILTKNSEGAISKVLLLADTNAYVDDTLQAAIDWKYDTIHPEQVEWASSAIKDLSERYNGGTSLKTLAFFHIPLGEYEAAYRELAGNGFRDTETVQHVSGIWDELFDAEMGGRIWYGGCCRTDAAPEDTDRFFEELGPDGLDSLEGCFCGHDHVNNAVVLYRGVTLAYGYSLDNLAYDGICNSGLQRGANLITLSPDGSWNFEQKNVYTDYGADKERFFPVYLDAPYYAGWAPYESHNSLR